MITPATQAEIQKGATTASVGVLASLLGFRMRRIHAHLTRTFSARLGDRALKPGGFSALALIVANPGLSQQMLSAELGQDKATVVQILDELEAHGWAERRREAGIAAAIICMPPRPALRPCRVWRARRPRTSVSPSLLSARRRPRP